MIWSAIASANGRDPNPRCSLTRTSHFQCRISEVTGLYRSSVSGFLAYVSKA